MKKLIISLLLITPLLTGCTNIETKLTINKDKSAQIVSSLTYKGDLADKFDEEAKLINENFNEFLNTDYKIDRAYGKKLSTITGSKKVEDILNNDIDLNSLGFKSNLPNGRFIEVKKNFLVTSYNIDAEYDYPAVIAKLKDQKEQTKNEESKDAMEPEYLQKYVDVSEMITEDNAEKDFVENIDDSAIELNKKDTAVNEEDKPINPPKEEPKDEDLKLSFSIELPAFAYFNNADSTDGNIYTWNINKVTPTVIKLQYVQYSGVAVFTIILLGILILMYLAHRILRHDAQKRVGTNN